MRALGIEFISVFGMPPVAFVELAAAVGCNHVSIGMLQGAFDPHGYPRYSIRDDAVLRRELKAALVANGVTISLGENLPVLRDADLREQWLADLELFAELGVPRVNSVSFEPDLARNVDRYGLLADIAAGFGIETLIEFVPTFGIADLPTALAVVRQVARPDLRLLIDTMHIGRSGASADDLRAIPPECVGYIQLCDMPITPAIPDYMDEARYERRVPGEGALPLADYLDALPCDRIIGLEIPMRAEAERGVGPRARVGRMIAAARTLLATLD